jgi:hypothetical protein
MAIKVDRTKEEKANISNDVRHRLSTYQIRVETFSFDPDKL